MIKQLLQYPKCSREEEQYLFSIINSTTESEKNKAAAKHQLVYKHLHKLPREVYAYRKNSFKPKVTVEDLIGIATVALYDSISGYDSTSEFRFFTYARHHIKTAIYSYYGNSNAVAVSSRVWREAKALKKTQVKFMKEYGRLPRYDEVRERLNFHCSYKHFLDINTLLTSTKKLEQLSPYAAPIPSPEETFLKKETEATINEAVKKLNAREQVVIKKLYGLNDADETSTEAVGRELNVGASQIRLMHKNAKQKLFKYVKELK